MRVIRDGLRFCDDCMLIAVTGEIDSLDHHYGTGPHPGRGDLRPGAKERYAAIEAGLTRLGPHLVPAFDSESGKGCDEFAVGTCDCCATRLAGARYEFAILGPGESMLTSFADAWRDIGMAYENDCHDADTRHVDGGNVDAGKR